MKPTESSGTGGERESCIHGRVGGGGRQSLIQGRTSKEDAEAKGGSLEEKAGQEAEKAEEIFLKALLADLQKVHCIP